MSPDKKPPSSENKNIAINGDVSGAVIIGDNNTVNQTIIQKFFNIFKSDAETLEQRNRRILLNHVENAWIKGVLDASLHGASLLDLGIKQDPEAVTKYPWAIKKESTDETLPAGTSMLDIFDNIGMGRSLLILGAPGSGKTTMLLELARQLIGRAREDVTYPIPMVFNLASWTEKLTLADWLEQELNNLYSVPRKTAPDWVKGNKLLLLLDGLDEVRQESRAKCVEAINEFRKEHGLTSLAVCSRSQDYADLNAKLSFEGAIEVQPLTQEQIHEFFNRFGDEMTGIKQVLKKDSALREMAETPLFLSIMIMAYRDKRDVEILTLGDEKARRKHLFDTYIQRMFERRLENGIFKKQDVLHWLSWLSGKTTKHNAIPYMLEDIQPSWLEWGNQIAYRFAFISLSCFLFGITFNVLLWLIAMPISLFYSFRDIKMIDRLGWNWSRSIKGSGIGFLCSIGYNIILSLVIVMELKMQVGLMDMLLNTLLDVPPFVLLGGLFGGVTTKPVNSTVQPGQRIFSSFINSVFVFALLLLGGILIVGLYTGLLLGDWSSILISGATLGLVLGMASGSVSAFVLGGAAILQHFVLRFILAHNNLLPWRLVPFLNHCVDLIFLRRVGGGYIFVDGTLR